ncbi:PqiC family protein [Asaia prunellae]|uniref:PqiC family protein n=1 Tax=Asaia prunellae TaxID=610245 RepID=UPI000683DD0D|nr:PqiC family protein [Asaia prunellae]
MNMRPLLSALALGLLSACASAPVQFYTIAPKASDMTLPQKNAPVIYVPRLSLPDYLDTQDILVRDGSRLVRSSNGRWASRLSQSATDLIVARLSQNWPQKMVTAYPPIDTPDARLGITIERLDLLKEGQATLLASWSELPRDETSPPLQGHATVSVQGSVADDAAKAALLQQLFERLADKIATSLPPR